MQKSSLAKILILVCLIAMLVGCEKPPVDPPEEEELSGTVKTWDYAFDAANYDIADWYIDWQFSYDYTEDPEIGTGGLYFDNLLLTSKASFTGDFIMEVDFTLDCEADRTVELELYPSDGWEWEQTNHLQTWFSNLGENVDLAESFGVQDNGPLGWNTPADGGEMALSGFVRKGPNTWKIKKVGNQVEMWINTFKYASFTAQYYDPSHNHLSLYAESGGGTVLFKGITVQYNGTMSVDM